MTDRTSIRATFGVDAISAASDSCVRCHRDGAPNHRTGVGASVTRKFDAYRWSIGGALSGEKFYRASTFTTALTRVLAEANTTVAAGLYLLAQPTHAASDAGRRESIPARRLRFRHADAVKDDHRPGRLRSRTPLRLPRQPVSPHRRERRHDAWSGSRHPCSADRVAARSAGAAGGHLPRGRLPPLRRRLGSRLDAFGAGLSHRFARALLADFSYRRYDQAGASFYARHTRAHRSTFTGDFRLAPFASDLYSGRVVINPGQSLFHLPAGYGITLQYDRYQSDNGFESAMFFPRDSVSRLGQNHEQTIHHEHARGGHRCALRDCGDRRFGHAFGAADRAYAWTTGRLRRWRPTRARSCWYFWARGASPVRRRFPRWMRSSAHTGSAGSS